MNTAAPVIDLELEDVAEALRDLAGLRRRLSLESDHAAQRSSRARVVVPCDEIAIPHDRLWRTDADGVVVGVARELIALTDRDDPRKVDAGASSLFGRHVPSSGVDARKKYLYQTALRVAQLCDVLVEQGATAGSVLEIGGLYGSFALSLARLGYDVTVVDRYEEMDRSVNGYIDHLVRAGVRVVSTTRANEVGTIERLGSFDCVIAMAVIEHVPHTPRHLLELMKAKTRSGGLVAVDTPNIARYWNRKRLAEGKSVFQDLAAQYYCEIPFEGHHREFTADEVRWMLEQLGCRDIRMRLFDYNMLQFDRIDRPHLDCLTALIEDPHCADMILACGRLD